jgi:hypothetical protein
MMWDFLKAQCSSSGGKQKDLRAQLKAEYGVDPLKAKHASRGAPLAQKEITAMMYLLTLLEKNNGGGGTAAFLRLNAVVFAMAGLAYDMSTPHARILELAKRRARFSTSNVKLREDQIGAMLRTLYPSDGGGSMGSVALDVKTAHAKAQRRDDDDDDDAAADEARYGGALSDDDDDDAIKMPAAATLDEAVAHCVKQFPLASNSKAMRRLVVQHYPAYAQQATLKRVVLLMDALGVAGAGADRARFAKARGEQKNTLMVQDMGKLIKTMTMPEVRELQRFVDDRKHRTRKLCGAGSSEKSRDGMRQQLLDESWLAAEEALRRMPAAQEPRTIAQCLSFLQEYHLVPQLPYNVLLKRSMYAKDPCTIHDMMRRYSVETTCVRLAASKRSKPKCFHCSKRQNEPLEFACKHCHAKYCSQECLTNNKRVPLHVQSCNEVRTQRTVAKTYLSKTPLTYKLHY